MPKQFNTGNDAILAKRKAANAMIARGAERPSTLITLDDGWIPGVKCAVH